MRAFLAYLIPRDAERGTAPVVDVAWADDAPTARQLLDALNPDLRVFALRDVTEQVAA